MWRTHLAGATCSMSHALLISQRTGQPRGGCYMTFFPGFRPASALLGLIIAVPLLWQSPAFAQETAGGVSGIVQDQTGAVIPGADVVVTNLDNKSERKTVSNGAGEFAISAITAGRQYQGRVAAPGLDTWGRG